LRAARSSASGRSPSVPAARTRSSSRAPRSSWASRSPSGSTGEAMPTREAEHRGLGEAAKVVAEHASQIARLEIELAVLELKRKVIALGVGIGLGVAALLFSLFALGFGIAAAAAAIATAVPTWAALLKIGRASCREGV